MISKPLLKATIKQNFMIFLIILAVLMLYLPIIIAMYDPATQIFRGSFKFITPGINISHGI